MTGHIIIDAVAIVFLLAGVIASWVVIVSSEITKADSSYREENEYSSEE